VNTQNSLEGTPFTASVHRTHHASLALLPLLSWAGRHQGQFSMAFGEPPPSPFPHFYDSGGMKRERIKIDGQCY